MICTAEFLLTYNANGATEKLSDEEIIKLAENYLTDTPEDKKEEYMVILTENYIKYKKDQKKIEEEINFLMEKSFKE